MEPITINVYAVFHRRKGGMRNYHGCVLAFSTADAERQAPPDALVEFNGTTKIAVYGPIAPLPDLDTIEL